MHHGRVLADEALALTDLNLKELSWRAVPRSGASSAAASSRAGI